MRGRTERSTPTMASRSSSQSCVRMFIIIVRLALVMSVMCRPPYDYTERESVGYVDPSGEIPNQPAIDCAHKDSMLFKPLFHLRNVRQRPVQLRAREIGRQRKACLLTIPLLVVGVCEIVDNFISSAIHPYDRIVHG